MLTDPGPNVPRGALAATQAAIDERLEAATGGHAGTVHYRPAKDSGEVLGADVDSGAADVVDGGG